MTLGSLPPLHLDSRRRLSPTLDSLTALAHRRSHHRRYLPSLSRSHSRPLHLCSPLLVSLTDDVVASPFLPRQSPPQSPNPAPPAFSNRSATSHRTISLCLSLLSSADAASSPEAQRRLVLPYSRSAARRHCRPLRQPTPLIRSDLLPARRLGPPSTTPPAHSLPQSASVAVAAPFSARGAAVSTLQPMPSATPNTQPLSPTQNTNNRPPPQRRQQPNPPADTQQGLQF